MSLFARLSEDVLLMMADGGYRNLRSILQILLI
jgi:hypothetical protein